MHLHQTIKKWYNDIHTWSAITHFYLICNNETKEDICSTWQGKKYLPKKKKSPKLYSANLSFYIQSLTHSFSLAHFTLYGHHNHMLISNSLSNTPNHFFTQNPPPSPTPVACFFIFY